MAEATTNQAAQSNNTTATAAVKEELAKVEADKKAEEEKTAKAAAAEVAVTASKKGNRYKLLHGKHFVGLDTDGNAKYAKVGDIVELTPSQAVNFANKFEQV